MSRCVRCDREGCPSQAPTVANDDGCFWPDCHRESCASCAAQNDCDRHRVDWRARYLALVAAVREERAAMTAWKRDAGTRPRWVQARAAVDRLLADGDA